MINSSIVSYMCTIQYNQRRLVLSQIYAHLVRIHVCCYCDGTIAGEIIFMPIDLDDKFISPWVHFQGQGLDPSIPPFLRVTGKVQNLCYSKGETEAFTNEIWTAKEIFENNVHEKSESKLSKSNNNNSSSNNNIVDDSEGVIETEDFSPNSNQGKIQLKDYFPIFLEVSRGIVI